MQKVVFSLVMLLLIPVLTTAQARFLTVEDATYMNPKLIAANLSQLQWQPGTEQFVYVASNCLVQGFATKSLRDTLIRLADLNFLLKYNKFDTLKRFPAITFLTAGKFRFINGTKLYVCDIRKNSIGVDNSWDDKAENLDFSKETNKLAFTKDNNLYITFNGRETAVTAEKNPDIEYGSNRVHRNEFGIDKGTFWSPDENMLAFYRMDQSMVTDYPLVNINTRIATVEPTKYPMAGMTSHKVTVGIYSTASGKTIYLQTDSSGSADSSLKIEYLTNITWSPDQKYIYIATLNRDQNFMQLNQYSSRDGRYIKTLFKEQNETYIEPMYGLRFLPKSSDKFIWESRRDGYNHLYLYNTNGELIQQLTSGKWEVSEFVSFDESSSVAYFLCNKDNPLDQRLYKVDLKNGGISPVTKVDGNHNAKITNDGRYILDTYTNTSVARRIDVLDVNGKLLQTLLAGENPLADYKLGETSLFTLKNDENTDLYCRLIKPVDFDPEKKYPVIIYVYGGPHSQLVTNSWLGGAGLFLNYLADQGYVVFTLDNRGTSNRGRSFEQAIFRNLGNKEVSDQMVGVKYLKSLPFVDSARIGLNGWSYGGFMTISMMLKNPGVFKVGVCGGPVIDWKYYEVMYGERYMDTPESNPKGYEDACLLNSVKNLQGKLLIIHDDQDGTVVLQNSLTFLKKCVDEGKQVDFFLYPGHPHNVRGKDRVHLNQKMALYFRDNL
ncbi:MAG: DPP IV N-terminal domain-containing protein [Bacteroidetes bacterium]|nr:DPP IV N-terminal domain-containing protein [Bacteroidota bacterium]